MILILLALIGALLYPIWKNYTDKKEDKIETVETEKVEVTEEQNDIVEPDAELGPEAEDKKIPQYDGEDPNLAAELSGAITFADVVDGKLMIRMNIDQYLNDGECRLTLKRGDTVIYNDTVKIASSASTSSCEGFDVPVAGLDTGKVDIVIDLITDDKKGIINGEANL